MQAREVWGKRVEQWKDSGLTAEEFAAEVGVNPRSLSWWTWRLNAEAKGEKSPPPTPRDLKARAPKRAPSKQRARKRSAKAHTKATRSMTFVEMPRSMADNRIEVILPSSVRVLVQTNFDATTLERLLGILDQRR